MELGVLFAAVDYCQPGGVTRVGARGLVGQRPGDHRGDMRRGDSKASVRLTGVAERGLMNMTRTPISSK